MDNNDWYRYYAPRSDCCVNPQRMADHRKRARRHLDAVLAWIGLQTPDRILQIGCGWGRHSLTRRARLRVRGQQ